MLSLVQQALMHAASGKAAGFWSTAGVQEGAHAGAHFRGTQGVTYPAGPVC